MLFMADPTGTPGVNPDDVDGYTIDVEFSLYFAVRTTQQINGAHEIFTQRSLANWQFDGSGNIMWQVNPLAPIWQNGAPMIPPNPNPQNNTGASTFTIVINGSVVPIAAGSPTPINLIAPGWQTGPQ
jgi:hypothetical protein